MVADGRERGGDVTERKAPGAPPRHALANRSVPEIFCRARASVVELAQLLRGFETQCVGGCRVGGDGAKQVAARTRV